MLTFSLDAHDRLLEVSTPNARRVNVGSTRIGAGFGTNDILVVYLCSENVFIHAAFSDGTGRSCVQKTLTCMNGLEFPSLKII